MSEFKTESTLLDGNLAMSIASALTPNGINANPLVINDKLINPTIVSV